MLPVRYCQAQGSKKDGSKSLLQLQGTKPDGCTNNYAVFLQEDS